MENRIEVKKRSSESVIMWRVDAESLTPNTILAPADGLTLIVTVDHETKTMAREYVLNSLFNPGKGKKLIGGNKPYKSFEILALDQSTEFEAEWGLGGPSALPCRDNDVGIDCKAVAFGKYRYKIANFIAFKNAFELEKTGVITRAQVRETLRSITTDIVHGYLAEQVAGKHLPDCRRYISRYCEDLQEAINRKLDSRGLAVEQFNIERLAFDPEHEKLVQAANNQRGLNYLHGIQREDASGDIDLRKKEMDDVIIPYMNAQNGRGQRKENAECFILCPRCRAKNPSSANYCSVCNEKL